VISSNDSTFWSDKIIGVLFLEFAAAGDVALVG
jgi:hypothetical protein